MGFFPEPTPPEPRHAVEHSAPDEEEPGADWVMSFEGDADEDGAEEGTESSWGPVGDVLPGAVAATILLGRSETGAVSVTAIRAYPDGVLMIIESRAAPDSPDLEMNEVPWRYGPDVAALRYGFEFADGRRATNVDDVAAPPSEDRQHAALVARGGSSTNRSTETELWLTPLPPPGPLIVACEWRARGIAFQTQRLDAGLFREAAARATPLWPGGASQPITE